MFERVEDTREPREVTPEMVCSICGEGIYMNDDYLEYRGLDICRGCIFEDIEHVFRCLGAKKKVVA